MEKKKKTNRKERQRHKERQTDGRTIQTDRWTDRKRHKEGETENISNV